MRRLNYRIGKCLTQNLFGEMNTSRNLARQTLKTREFIHHFFAKFRSNRQKLLDISWQPYLEAIVWSLAKDVGGCSCTFFLLTAFSPKCESRKYIF